MALQDLKNAAQAIKDQTKIYGNTHTMIGELLLQMLNIILTNDLITQLSGTDPGKVMSQKAVTSLINSLNTSMAKLTSSVHIDEYTQGEETIYLQISSHNNGVGRIGIDWAGNAFFEHIDSDQVVTRYQIASKEDIAVAAKDAENHVSHIDLYALDMIDSGISLNGEFQAMSSAKSSSEFYSLKNVRKIAYNLTGFSQCMVIAFYSRNSEFNSFISGVQGNDSLPIRVGVVDVPVNAKYVRFTNIPNSLDTNYIITNSSILSYINDQFK